MRIRVTMEAELPSSSIFPAGDLPATRENIAGLIHMRLVVGCFEEICRVISEDEASERRDLLLRFKREEAAMAKSLVEGMTIEIE